MSGGNAPKLSTHAAHATPHTTGCLGVLLVPVAGAGPDLGSGYLGVLPAGATVQCNQLPTPVSQLPLSIPLLNSRSPFPLPINVPNSSSQLPLFNSVTGSRVSRFSFSLSTFTTMHSPCGTEVQFPFPVIFSQFSLPNSRFQSPFSVPVPNSRLCDAKTRGAAWSGAAPRQQILLLKYLLKKPLNSPMI